jgi:hypothetical protein
LKTYQTQIKWIRCENDRFGQSFIFHFEYNVKVIEENMRFVQLLCF